MAKDEAGATGGARLGQPAARALVARLNQDAARIAGKFGLTCRAIVAERPSARGHYGICYEDGLIKIRLQHATRGTPLKYSSLVNTLCHELAHLRHFDHSEAFQRFYGALLSWARRQSIYRPGRRASAGEALPPEDCGIDPEERRRILSGMWEAVDRARSRSSTAEQLPLF